MYGWQRGTARRQNVDVLLLVLLWRGEGLMSRGRSMEGACSGTSGDCGLLFDAQLRVVRVAMHAGGEKICNNNKHKPRFESASAFPFRTNQSKRTPLTASTRAGPLCAGSTRRSALHWAHAVHKSWTSVRRTHSRRSASDSRGPHQRYKRVQDALRAMLHFQCALHGFKIQGLLFLQREWC